MTLDKTLVPSPVLDPDRRADKAERMANLVFQKSLIGEVQLHLAIGEDEKRRRSHRRLCHVKDSYLLTGGDRGTFEVHMLEKAVHLAGSDSPPALDGDFFQRWENFLGTLSGRGRDEQYRGVGQEFQSVAQPLLVGGAICGALVLLHARRLSRPPGTLLAADYQIPFVHDDDHRAPALVSISGDGSVKLAYAFGCIDHQQSNVGGFKVLASHHDRELFRHQVRFAFASDAGSIDKAKAFAMTLDNLVDRVPRGARNG